MGSDCGVLSMGPIQPRLVRRKTEHPRTKPACLDILGFWGVTRGRGVRVPASAAPTLHPTNSKKVMSHEDAQSKCTSAQNALVRTAVLCQY